MRKKIKDYIQVDKGAMAAIFDPKGNKLAFDRRTIAPHPQKSAMY
jgi:hypothetical protein